MFAKVFGYFVSLILIKIFENTLHCNVLRFEPGKIKQQ